MTRGIIQEELIKIWNETQQTVFMITHDVDEAILLADRILLMTNGPHARIAESVKVSIPRPSKRTDIIHHDAYYLIRNHLVDFLVNRSRELAGEVVADPELPVDSSHPVEVDPSLVNPEVKNKELLNDVA